MTDQICLRDVMTLAHKAVGELVLAHGQAGVAFCDSAEHIARAATKIEALRSEAGDGQSIDAAKLGPIADHLAEAMQIIDNWERSHQ